MIESKFKDVISWDIDKMSDERGWLMEFFREDCLDFNHRPLMGYVSCTKPGVRRGPHEHEMQTDLFVFIGPGDFELHLWDNRGTSHPDKHRGNHEKHVVGESNPCAVMVPPGVVHGYMNVSEDVAICYNYPNTLYAGFGKRYPVDEIRHEDREGSEFQF